MIRAKIRTRPLRVLDFDIETRRVGFHQAGRFNPDGCEPVAIAAGWVGESRVAVQLRPEADARHMLLWFRNLWEQADMVTGHYIRKFDIPIINGALLEHRLPLLSPKLVQDTKGDLKDIAGLSQSQENLGKMLDIQANKFHMADNDWRAIARFDPDAMESCRKRVTKDVRQHKELRVKLLALDALRNPRRWTP